MCLKDKLFNNCFHFRVSLFYYPDLIRLRRSFIHSGLIGAEIPFRLRLRPYFDMWESNV
jgi:hypothetical protein